MLSPTSKIWIYQASRTLSVPEYDTISKKLDVFVSDWSSHGSKLLVRYEIKHFRFIILVVDESQATISGCSIDKSVHFMTELGNELGLNFIDRNLVYVENDELFDLEIKNIKSAVLDRKLHPETLVFDNTVTTLEEFEKRWLTKASETWLKRYFVGNLV